MYDTSFDHAQSRIRGSDRTLLWALRVAAMIATIAVASANGQLPQSPALQNAWASPGIVGAVNVSGGSDGSVYAAVASWAPSNRRFQFSGGVGYQTRTGSGSAVAYGARVAVPFGDSTRAFGFAPFAGAGGGGGSRRVTLGVFPDTLTDSTTSSAQFPVGVGVGWRRVLGNSRGLSFYATPSYVFFTGGGNNGGLFRASVAADVGVTRVIGVTAGVEFGATRARGLGGPTGTLYGLGVSYALGRR